MLHPVSSQCCQPCEVLQANIDRCGQFCQIDIQQKAEYWYRLLAGFSTRKTKPLQSSDFLINEKKH
jgi:hypothetical protein